MRAGKKVLWLFLLIAGLLACLGSPAMLLAQEAKVDLSLRMLPDYYYKEVIPGEDNTLFMEIRNRGDKEITNIRFNSDKPEGWVVDFKPGSIDYFSSGSSQTIDVKVIPGLDTSRGEYNLTFGSLKDDSQMYAFGQKLIPDFLFSPLKLMFRASQLAMES